MIDLILQEVKMERCRQDRLWGEQNHPIVVPLEIPKYAKVAEQKKCWCDEMTKSDMLTWADILLEGVYEVLAEEDECKQRTELIQVAAVAVAMVEYLDRKANVYKR